MKSGIYNLIIAFNQPKGIVLSATYLLPHAALCSGSARTRMCLSAPAPSCRWPRPPASAASRYTAELQSRAASVEAVASCRSFNILYVIFQSPSMRALPAADLQEIFRSEFERAPAQDFPPLQPLHESIRDALFGPKIPLLDAGTKGRVVVVCGSAFLMSGARAAIGVASPSDE